MIYTTRILILCAFLFLMNGTVISAEIHKWVDEHGRVHYGDKPVEEGKSEKIDVQTSKPDESNSRLEKQKQVLEALEASRQEREQQLADKHAELEAKKQHEQECNEMRNELADYERGGIIWYDLDEKGKRVFLDDDEVEKRKNNLREAITKICGDKFE